MQNQLQVSQIKYQIHGFLGEGLNSCVYKASRKTPCESFKDEVALKIFKSRTVDQLPMQDYESLRVIHSPNCVQVYGFEVINDRPALVLELIEGVSLLKLALSCELKASHLLYIVSHVIKGLKDIHSSQLLHGDLSPQNILIQNNGQVKLIDFGLSNFNHSKNLHVTPEFVDPDVLRGEPMSSRSDFYSLKEIIRFCHKFSIASGPETRILEQLMKSSLNELKIFDEVCSYFAKKDTQHIQTDLSQLVLKTEVTSYVPAEPEAQSGATLALTKSKESAIEKKTRVWYWRAVTGFFLFLGLMLPLSPVQSNSTLGPVLKAYIHVRTHKWYRLRVNSKDVGFAPVSITVKEGPVLIEWSQNLKKGRRALTIKGGENIVITDSFFKKPH